MQVLCSLQAGRRLQAERWLQAGGLAAGNPGGREDRRQGGQAAGGRRHFNFIKSFGTVGMAQGKLQNICMD